jgi:K+-transporting ATPase ATPase C chain
MLAHLRASLWLLVLTVLLCSVLYPAVVWLIGQTAFHDKAEGSLLVDAQGHTIGSRLIAQPFTADEYFWPRPSAVAYNASASGPSNYAASNPALRDRVAGWLRDHRHADSVRVPADLVTTSGSGLDPDITLSGATWQLDRVAAAWANKTGIDQAELRSQIGQLLEEQSYAPLGGLVGVRLVNVLEVNVALRDRYQKAEAGAEPHNE